MKKGIVTKLTTDYAIVLSDDVKYEKVKLKNNMNIGEKIYYFKEDILNGNLRRKTYNISALIASFLIIAIITSLIVLTPSKNAYASMHAAVTVDINPSIELIIDFDDKVTRIKALNDDADNIINDDMLGMSLEDVLEIILENARLQGYLLEDDAILISSVVLNERDEDAEDDEDDEDDEDEEDEEVKDNEDKDNEDLEEKINAFMEKKQEQYTFLYVKGTQEALRAANSNGLSLGKYEMLKFFNEDITKEEIKHMKVTAITERKEIKEQLKQQKGMRYIHSEEEEKVTFDEEGDTEEDATDVKDKNQGKDNNANGNDKDKDNHGNGNNTNIENGKDKDNDENNENNYVDEEEDNNIDDDEENDQGKNDKENGKSKNGQGNDKSNNNNNKR